MCKKNNVHEIRIGNNFRLFFFIFILTKWNFHGLTQKRSYIPCKSYSCQPACQQSIQLIMVRSVLCSYSVHVSYCISVRCSNVPQFEMVYVLLAFSVLTCHIFDVDFCYPTAIKARIRRAINLRKTKRKVPSQ